MHCNKDARFGEIRFSVPSSTRRKIPTIYLPKDIYKRIWSIVVQGRGLARMGSKISIMVDLQER